jgi:hypothetical protein
MNRRIHSPSIPASRRWRGWLLGLALVGAGLGNACQLDKLLRAPAPGEDGSSSPAVRLLFGVQPATADLGVAITPAVEVTAVDASGAPVPSFVGTIVVGLSSNPGEGSLAGITTRAAVQGRAAFPDLSIDQPGTGYQLSASSGGLASATSDPFDVRSEPPSALAAVSGNGQTDTVAATLPSPYVVRVTDSRGDPVKAVEVRWAADASGGSVAPAVVVTDQAGEARTVHTLGTIVGQYSVTASVTALPGQAVTFTSAARAGAGAQLTFTQQPTDTKRGKRISPPVQVTVHDRFGNTATDFTTTVTMTIAPGTGTPGARLEGDRTRNPSAGVATFSDLKIDDIGFGYRLRASAGGLTGDSAPFNVLLFDDDDDDLLSALTITSANAAIMEPERIRR